MSVSDSAGLLTQEAAASKRVATRRLCMSASSGSKDRCKIVIVCMRRFLVGLVTG
jgi:hypothetical protein